MEECNKLFDKKVFTYLMKIMPNDIKDELKNCDDKTGGKNKRMRRKMRGGDEAFKKKIMVCLYLFLGIVISYLIATTETVTLEEGFLMLWQGRCTSLSEMSLNMIGFGNPVCSKYQKMIAVVGYALKFDTTAITQLIGAFTLTVGTAVATPYIIHNTIMGIATQIESRVAQLTGGPLLEIQNSEEIPSDRQIMNGAIVTANDLMNQIKAQPGLLEQLREVINSGEMQELNLDEEAIEEVDAASRAASKESSYQEEYGGSKRSKKNRRRNSKKNKKNKKHTRKHHKRSKKNRRH